MSDIIHTAHSVVDWTGYLTHAEVDALKQLAMALPQDAQIVNIGAGNGTSGLAFMETRADLKVTTIDIQLEGSPFGCLAGEEAVLRGANLWGDPRYQQIHGDSKAIGREWLTKWGGLVDMVFVDGGHMYHEATGDITIWLANLKPQGIIAVHDFEKTEKIWPGVDRAVRELLIGRYPQVLRVDHLIAFENTAVTA
jgi:predicted O-methyltransferase YrrM